MILKFIDSMDKRSQAFRTSAGSALLLTIWIVDYVTGFELRMEPFYLIPLAFSGWYIDKTTGFVFSAITVGIITLTDALTGKTFERVLPEMWNASMRLGFYLVVVYLLSRLRSTMQERADLIKKLQDSLKEVKELRGILPICSSCKKIRTDEGYWQNVDEYITHNTKAEFTHGLCNDCAKKLYPQLYDKIAGKKDNE